MGDTAINPALESFLSSFAAERAWAQVLIRRTARGFELCHAADRDLLDLRAISLPELRKLTNFSAAGQFRPLRSAPDLQRGWKLLCRTEAELWRALQELYPGSIPDWHAVQTGRAVAADYRTFTNRQTGMYRITQLNTDQQAAQVIQACCPAHLCLKRRLWSVTGLPGDAPEQKSEIPCLEPCAVFLELARKAARIEQEEKRAIELPLSDAEAILAALQHAIEHPPRDTRAGDIASPLNARRLQLALVKHRERLSKPPARETD